MKLFRKKENNNNKKLQVYDLINSINSSNLSYDMSLQRTFIPYNESLIAFKLFYKDIEIANIFGNRKTDSLDVFLYHNYKKITNDVYCAYRDILNEIRFVDETYDDIIKQRELKQNINQNLIQKIDELNDSWNEFIEYLKEELLN